ncbi:MAG: Peroxisomal membrane signal receptor PTS1 [Watsoniomyces obsoletus]|nr:MAG: Peroxisomal membrane signal receptor PTS1 [Watsoniomyces obsoletus]
MPKRRRTCSSSSSLTASAMQTYQTKTKTKTQPKPRLLLLSLPDSPIPFSAVRGRYTDFLKELKDKYKLIETTDTYKAIEEMAKPSNLAAVLVVDGGIVKPEHRDLGLILAFYARAGGTVLLGCAFGSGVGPPDLNHFFQMIWDLPWRYAFCGELEVHTNTNDCTMINWDKNIKDKIEIREMLLEGDDHTALVLTNVPIDDQVYYCTTEVGWGCVSNASPAAVVKVGRGVLGYAGFVNAEGWLAPVYLALCDLKLS